MHHGGEGGGRGDIPSKIIFAVMATGSPTVSAIAEWPSRGCPYASIATVWRSWGQQTWQSWRMLQRARHADTVSEGLPLEHHYQRTLCVG